MNHFKAALKEAIQKKAAKLVFVVGRSPYIVLATGQEVSFNHIPTLQASNVQTYFATLFQQDQGRLLNQERVRGTLSIINFGEMSLIGDPKEGKVAIYVPPVGLDLFKKDWAAQPPAEIPSPVLAPPSLPSAFELPQTIPPEPKAGLPTLLMAEMPTLTPRELPPLAVPSGDFNLPDLSEAPPPLDPLSPFMPAAVRKSIPITDSFAPMMIDSMVSDGIPSFRPIAELERTNPDFLSDDPIGLAPTLAPSLGHNVFEAALDLAPLNTAVPDRAGLKIASSFDTPQNLSMAPLAPVQPLASPAVTASPAPIGSSAPKNVDVKVDHDDEDYHITFDANLPNTTAPTGDFPINQILQKMVSSRASDLHLTGGQPIIMRIDGGIHRADSTILTPEKMESLLLPIMPETYRRQFYKTHDCDFSYAIEGLGRFRVNIFRDRNGVGAVLRLIPSRVLTADEIGLKPAIRRLCQLSKGLVLVTGPTGSGKSTTLAAMIDLINSSRDEHILTIEDPIEFVHGQKQCLINQREMHAHTKSFSTALRAALREDPDIVLIGEMRDLETVSIAIETAETGHLVFGTLHTTTAVSTVDRIIDQFPEAQQNQVRSMLANSLKGVVAQVLLKKKGGGRVAAQEILIVSNSVASLIRENKVHMIPNDMQTKKAEGNQLMNETLFEYIKSGVVEAAEAIRKSANPDQFRAFLESRGVQIT